MSKLLLKEIASKYYNDLEAIINDLAVKCTGGEQYTLVFPNGEVTIKLR